MGILLNEDNINPDLVEVGRKYSEEINPNNTQLRDFFDKVLRIFNSAQNKLQSKNYESNIDNLELDEDSLRDIAMLEPLVIYRIKNCGKFVDFIKVCVKEIKCSRKFKSLKAFKYLFESIIGFRGKK